MLGFKSFWTARAVVQHQTGHVLRDIGDALAVETIKMGQTAPRTKGRCTRCRLVPCLVGVWLALLLLGPGQASADPIVVSGKVTTTKGAPVAGVGLRFKNDNSPSAFASSDENGAYLVDLAGGDYYDVEVTPPAGSSLLAQVLADTVIARSTTLDFALHEPGFVSCSGRLLDNTGSPIVGATVTAGPRDASVMATTDAVGVFLATIDATLAPPRLQRAACSSSNGCMHFGPNADSYLSPLEAIWLACGGLPNPEIIWKVAVYTGKVVTKNDAPVAGAVVTWTSRTHAPIKYTRGNEADEAEGDWSTTTTLVTNANGDVEFLSSSLNGYYGGDTWADVAPPEGSELAPQSFEGAHPPFELRLTSKDELDAGPPSVFCSDVTECDDANPRTLDSCSAGICAHAFVTAPTCREGCDDGAPEDGSDASARRTRPGRSCQVGFAPRSSHALPIGSALLVLLAANRRRKKTATRSCARPRPIHRTQKTRQLIALRHTHPGWGPGSFVPGLGREGLVSSAKPGGRDSRCEKGSPNHARSG